MPAAAGPSRLAPVAGVTDGRATDCGRLRGAVGRLGGLGTETGGCDAGGFMAGALNDRGAGTSTFGDVFGAVAGLGRGGRSTFGIDPVPAGAF